MSNKQIAFAWLVMLPAWCLMAAGAFVLFGRTIGLVVAVVVSVAIGCAFRPPH